MFTSLWYTPHHNKTYPSQPRQIILLSWRTNLSYQPNLDLCVICFRGKPDVVELDDWIGGRGVWCEVMSTMDAWELESRPFGVAGKYCEEEKANDVIQLHKGGEEDGLYLTEVFLFYEKVL